VHGQTHRYDGSIKGVFVRAGKLVEYFFLSAWAVVSQPHLVEVDFLNHVMVQDAVIRIIEFIGEASNNIQRGFPEFAALHDDTPSG